MRIKLALTVLLVFGLAVFGLMSETLAWTAKEIDAGVGPSLDKLKNIQGGNTILKKAVGLLVFPAVFKAGIGLGGEYGEGALLIKGKTVDYYSTAAASIGFQLGAQKKTIIIAFMDKGTLKDFRNSEGWKVGADASVTVVTVGADGSIDTAKTNKPIVAFVFNQKGLMYNLTLEGAKITKLKR
ncbi:MAG: lipid-binding SYLF domain-containing protein [Candidatus Omnitrophica bacterium]|nr:lipid-binding SYLF domain-containing protein [Candidatus Omnitrophota bacterium]